MKKVLALMICLILALTLVGCIGDKMVPSVSSIQSSFHAYHEDICIVSDYIVASEYQSIFIHSDGRSWADFDDLLIEAPLVNESVSHLFQDGEVLFISKRDNTIQFELWMNTHDVGCGIAYSINETDAPEIQYLTELQPLDESGWYYYVSDYYKYRSEH